MIYWCMENVNMAFCLISEKKLYGLFSIKHFLVCQRTPCLTPQRDFVIIAKFVKDKPGMHLKFIYLLLSASLCNRALGMRNGRIRNNQITSSSEVNRFHTAWLGRLGRVKTGRYIGAWCPKHRNHLQWLKVDFGRLMKITKIATQGRQDAGHWVTSYYVLSSIDNVHWAMYRFRSSNKVRSHLF